MTFEDRMRKRSPERHKETKELKAEFWTHRSDRYLDENITTNNALPLTIEDTELLRISYGRFISRDQAPALIHIKHDVDQGRFDSLYAHIDSVGKEFGGKLLWDRREGVESGAIGRRFNGGLDAGNKLDILQDSRIETMDGLKKAFKTHIKRLK